jgi:hypothetical protein
MRVLRPAVCKNNVFVVIEWVVLRNSFQNANLVCYYRSNTWGCGNDPLKTTEDSHDETSVGVVLYLVPVFVGGVSVIRILSTVSCVHESVCCAHTKWTGSCRWSRKKAWFQEPWTGKIIFAIYFLVEKQKVMTSAVIMWN